MFTFSGVGSPKIAEFEKMKHIHFKMEEDLTNKTTHLVCATNENSACKRTIKFFQAMVSGAAIVSVKWLEQCAKSRKWLDLSREHFVKGAVDHDSTAPYRSYTNHNTGTPALFTGLNFYIDKKLPSCKIDRDVLCEFIKSCNGKLLNRVPKEAVSLKMRAYHADHDSILHSNPTVIVSDSYKSKGILVRPPAWVLKCISNFKLAD